MIKELHTESSILKKVKEAKDFRGYQTYKECCDAFNKEYQKDIEKGLVKSLNKDFLYRTFSGKTKFTLSNHRFAKFCEFLKVDTHETHTPLNISKAALMVDELIRQKPELEKQIHSVVRSITNLSKGVQA